jgi:hypothetical protein
MAGRARYESVKGEVFHGRRVPRCRLQGVRALDEPLPRQRDLPGRVAVGGFQQVETGGEHRVAVVEQVRVQEGTELGCVLR